MALGFNGVTTPAGSDGFDPQGDMVDLNASLHGRIMILADNATARAALTTTCGWGPVATDPLVVLQTDTRDVWLYNGTTWYRPGRAIFAGTETALVGTNPPAATEVITQQFTFTGTTDGGGGLTITFPTAFAHGLCGSIFTLVAGGTYWQPYAAKTLAHDYIVVLNSSHAPLASTSVTVSVIAWGW